MVTPQWRHVRVRFAAAAAAFLRVSRAIRRERLWRGEKCGEEEGREEGEGDGGWDERHGGGGRGVNLCVARATHSPPSSTFHRIR